MPGMGSGLKTNNPTIVAAFRTLLEHQAIFVLVLLAILAVGWNVLRAVQLRNQASGAGREETLSSPEPVARHLLRVSFGLIWIFDGILQAQASMPLGMTTQVIQPSAAAIAGQGLGNSLSSAMIASERTNTRSSGPLKPRTSTHWLSSLPVASCS